MTRTSESPLHRIVVVGGGAGGLELASKLGKKLGKKKRAHITLIDANLTHIWKPLLHEVAAGTMDSNEDKIEYMVQARFRHFDFRLGRMDGLDRSQRQVKVAPTYDADGFEIIPRRSFNYDTLVIAVGSNTNGFGIPGVQQYCVYLDSAEQAERFHQTLLKNYIRANTQTTPLKEGQLHVAIVGAGATGVELAAELHDASNQLVAYGMDRITLEQDVKISIIEAGDRILPALPPRLSLAAQAQLQQLGVRIYTNERVSRVTEDEIHTASGHIIPAQMKVWAAGIKAPDFLKDVDGLETNPINQLVVEQTLQTTRDENIFALGDCASCPQPGSDRPVPPRAQAAHQQASTLVKTIVNRLEGKPAEKYVYRDYGSLVSMSRYSTVGSLMGSLMGSVMLEGRLAKLVYITLYKSHLMALQGFFRVALNTLANLLKRSARPRMKLH